MSISTLSASIFTNILYIIAAIVILLLMVMIHELGHFIAGRILKFKITEFSIGFGKAIFSKVNKRGERISLRIFPLGGYCAFEGEGDDDSEEDKETEKVKEVADNLKYKKDISIDDMPATDKKISKYNPHAFNNQKPWKRIIVYLAGVTFNFISAIIFAFILLVSYGYDYVRVTEINPTYASNLTQLQQGDIIYGVDGTTIDFAKGNTLSALISKHKAGDEITLTIKRDGKMLENDISVIVSSIPVLNEDGTPKLDENNNPIFSIGLGISVASAPLPFWEALARCVPFACGLAWIVLKAFWQIITFQIPLSQLGGPISTVSMIATTASNGFASILVLLPLLAANLAVFNLLPIPALDGSHIVFTTIEWIRGKPINRKTENYIHFFGLIALFAFVILVDIIHLVS